MSVWSTFKTFLRPSEQGRRGPDQAEDSHAFDEALLGSIADGVFAVDKNGTIALANPAVERMLGWKFSEMQGKDRHQFFVLVDENGMVTPKEQRPFSNMLYGGSHEPAFDEGHFLVRRNGTKFPVAINAAPIINKGVVIGAVGIVRDVTREKETERAKSEFLSLASHQLRTPLTAIGWNVQLLLASKDKLDPDQRQYLSEVATAQKRMVELVNALLDITRIELGTFVVKPEPTNIQGILDEVLKEIHLDIVDKRLRVDQEIAADTHEITSDPLLLRMILQNLITNAVIYSAKGGSIHITIGRRTPDLIISVSDTGIGIPEDQQANIFTKLFRADNARTTNPSGNGLGLYIVKSTVDKLGGRVWFESQQNKGTTFFVSLPLFK